MVATTQATDIPKTDGRISAEHRSGVTNHHQEEADSTTTHQMDPSASDDHDRAQNERSPSVQSYRPHSHQSEVVTMPSSTLSTRTSPVTHGVMSTHSVTTQSTPQTHIPRATSEAAIPSTTPLTDYTSMMTSTTPTQTTTKRPPRKRGRKSRKNQNRKSKSGDSAAACRGDKSFFCRLGVNKRNCLLHLYSTMCCGSCKKFV